MRQKSYFNRISLAVCLCLIVLAANAFGQKTDYIKISLSNDKAVFDAVGGYLSLGKISQKYEFRFEVIRALEKNKENIEVVGVFGEANPTNTGAAYRLSEFAIKNQKFEFRTEKINEISFVFSGNILKKGSLARFYGQSTPVLEGFLTKFTGDKATLKIKVRFRYRALKAPYYLP